MAALFFTVEQKMSRLCLGKLNSFFFAIYELFSIMTGTIAINVVWLIHMDLLVCFVVWEEMK